MKYIGSSGSIYLITEIAYTFTNLSPNLPTPAPGNYFSTLCFGDFNFFF